MREILFRGKQSALPEWIEGFYFAVPVKNKVSSDTENIHLITPCDFDVSGSFVNSSVIVIPETIGQYTGLTDMNGNKIFEGDIIKNIVTGEKGVIQWFDERSAFMMWSRTKNAIYFLYANAFSNIRIVGNAYDNPELLK